MEITKEHTQNVLNDIARRYRGPGGAIAVVKDGEVIGQRVWGFADLDTSTTLTAETRFPICSITKQFVCALLIDLERNPPPALAAQGDVRGQLLAHVKDLLSPELKNSDLTIEQLCSMQSGLRDYWAMTTLMGAKPDDEFLIARDCPPMLALTKSFQFEPGTETSYCNLNFHVVAQAIECATGETLGKLLEERILRPAGMYSAFLCPNTAEHPLPCVGYEGDETRGYVPAVNRLEWAGDAGLVASLKDMIAYEKYLDRCSSDPSSWYNEVIAPFNFKDGTPARYRYGLGHVETNGVITIGHGGALRGYRLHRRHAPALRLSVVVLFNNDAEASEPTAEIFRSLLNMSKPEEVTIQPATEWFGAFLDEDTQLSIVVTRAEKQGEVSISCAGSPEPIRLDSPISGKSWSMTATIDGDTLRIHRPGDNRKLVARRIAPKESVLKDDSFKGLYQCSEIDSSFRCFGEAGTLYGVCTGYLGRGMVTPMRYLGDDVWVLTCPRGLDAPAPGDWTMVFRRDEQGVAGFTIGCWLARGLKYEKIQDLAE
jgi:CubicO group peptidase (beta-lactamase class C family)